MKRCNALLASLVASLVGFLVPTIAIAPPTASASVITYAYDTHHASAQLAMATPGRGPPVASDLTTAYDAVDHWSRGVSGRPDGAGAPAAFAYDHPTSHNPVAGSALGTTLTEPDAGPGRLTAFERLGVAANSTAVGTRALSYPHDFPR